MAERGVAVDHSTINRWVLKFAPEIDKRIRPFLNPTNDSWRVDETYIEGLYCKDFKVRFALSNSGRHNSSFDKSPF